MKRFFAYIVLALTCVVIASAAPDKKQLKQLKADMDVARTAIKNSKNLEASETTLRKYLSDSLFSQNKDIHVMLFDVLHKEYQIINEQMYLKQNVDTAKMVSIASRLFVAAEALDSVDALPNDKGVSSPSYRKRNAELLVPYMDNLFKGGQYFYAHKKWSDCVQLLGVYLSMKDKALFSGQVLPVSKDTHAAFLAMSSAVQLKQLPSALQYSSLAVQFEPRRESALQMIAQLCAENKDSIRYASYLMQGFAFYPASDYFFPHLIDYYASKGEYNVALKFADDALQKDSTNSLFILARHSMLMMKKQYDDALEAGLRFIAINDSLPLPNYNVGYIYYQRAQEAMNQKGKAYRQRMRDAQKQYRLCLPYMERYRKACPENKDRWRPILYDVYLNLNMGKEFGEIENM